MSLMDSSEAHTDLMLDALARQYDPDEFVESMLKG
jgi:hypothetical protein